MRGRFYRPLEEAVSLRLDADVLDWLKKDGAGYQTRVNRMLREWMMKDLEGRQGSAGAGPHPSAKARTDGAPGGIHYSSELEGT